MNSKAITLEYEDGTSALVLADSVPDAFRWSHINRQGDNIIKVTYRYLAADLTKEATSNSLDSERARNAKLEATNDECNKYIRSLKAQLRAACIAAITLRVMPRQK